MMERPSLATNRPYYEVIRDLLAANIDGGRLPVGTRLITAAVADRLGVSRPPVKRALARLEREGRLRYSRKTGYVVGAARDGVEPVRLNLHALDLDLSGPLSPPSPQATWERIFQTVESDILNCMPFGTYQISEAGLGDHFSVSRTVIRDVLSRMQDRALISKDRSSHWIAGPLSARMLDDAHATTTKWKKIH